MSAKPVPQTVVDNFICTCKDEGRERARQLMAEVRRRLPQPGSVTDANFVGRVAESLEWQFDARITEIASDQWSRVTAESWDGAFKTRIDCDIVEDGIAATWKAFADRDARKQPAAHEAAGKPRPTA